MMIRAMGAADLITLSQLEQICFKDPWSLAAFEEELSNPNARFLVAESEGAIVGYIGAWKVLDEYDIANVAVSPDFRRQGVASQLLQALIAAAETERIFAMTLEVRVSNLAAIQLYRRFGFVSEGVRHKYYSDGEDAFIMWKK